MAYKPKGGDMSDIIDFPSQLPMPQQRGYKLKHVSGKLVTRMRSGRSRQRVIFTSTPTMVPVNWLMNEVQAQLFEGWYRWTAVEGTKWFNCRIKTPMGIKDYVCRFTDIYDGPELEPPNRWRFSAELEIRERQTIGEGELEFPDEIYYSSLFDKTMNKHWPEV